MHTEVWDEIPDPFPNFKWISNFIPHLIIDVVIIHAGI